MQQNIATFIQTQKPKHLVMKAIFTIHLNQSMVRLYQTYKHLLEKIWAGLLIQSSITLVIFQIITP